VRGFADGQPASGLIFFEGPQMLDSDLLAEFCKTFLGYGELTAPIWFIGMEEGGGERIEEIEARLDAWVRRNMPVVDDLAVFHQEFGDTSRFVPGAPIQSTWRQLMRTMLILRGMAQAGKAATELIRQYQIAEFGRIGSGVALLELMPLPKPGINEWPYDAWTCPDTMPYLQSIPLYKAEIEPIRIDAIRQAILDHGPRVVVFYGKGYQKQWEAICGMPFRGDGYPLVARAETPGAQHQTVFLLLPHPAAHGSITVHYENAAAMLAGMGVLAPAA
jgi:hypothetical protein